MKLGTLIEECVAYDFKSMLKEKRPKSWLKSVSAFSNEFGMGVSGKVYKAKMKFFSFLCCKYRRWNYV
jgi:predicted HTH transcriptional regulator